jgi:hypothetical protein
MVSDQRNLILLDALVEDPIVDHRGLFRFEK